MNKLKLLFIRLWDSMKAAYLQLSVEEQNAMIAGSGILAVINKMLDNSPAAVRNVITDKFPSIDADRLFKGISDICKAFGLDTPETMEDGIAIIQAHLIRLQGKAWEDASFVSAQLLSFALNPAMRMSVIASLLEWVYNRFIRKAIA